MKIKILHAKYRRNFFLSAAAILLAAVSFSFPLLAQSQRAADSERSTCKIKVNDKYYEPRLNQFGYFDRISNLPLDATVTVEISYPDGSDGEQVVISVEDGGKLDNGKTVKVAQLDNQKKLSFSFRFIADDPGVYRITLRKGNDEKVVQLWAAAPTSSTIK
ncbi:MAG TPA: hypothetical protein VE978_06585 [Chitinophagales bacterium]|nr:hypothetical protein [Chitinophagales bacterium]